MRRMKNRVAGLDVHRDSVTACVEVFDGTEVSVFKDRFSTTAKGVRELAEWLADAEVELVVMESTGVYWKPLVRHEAPCNRGEMEGLPLRVVAAAW